MTTLDTGIAGRVALVTGGSMGIGLAVATALARQGARIAVCARDASRLEAAAAEIGSTGTDVLAVSTDVRDPAAIERFVAAAAERFGRVDILVNNAVASLPGRFDTLSDEAFRQHVDVKLMGYIRCTRAVLPHMRHGRWGRIVNVAGMTARIVGDDRITNGVVNAGVTNFSKHLAQQVGRDGITVNAVHPGYTRTPRLEAMLRHTAQTRGIDVDEATAARTVEIPIGRLIETDDIAHLAVFLCSDLAGAITGQAIAVDGGSGQAINY